MSSMRFSRRDFARLSAAAGAVVARYSPLLGAAIRGAAPPVLAEFGYGDVAVGSAPHQAQLQNTHDVLMNLSEDRLVKPFPQMVGQPAPRDDLGGTRARSSPSRFERLASWCTRPRASDIPHPRKALYRL